MRKFYLLFFFFLLSSASYSQLLENYQNQWEEGGETTWFESNDRLKLNLDFITFPRSYYSIDIPSETVVFLGEKLWFFAEKDTSLNLSLEEFSALANSPKIDLTLFKSGISIDQVKIIHNEIGQNKNQDCCSN